MRDPIAIKQRDRAHWEPLTSFESSETAVDPPSRPRVEVAAGLWNPGALRVESLLHDVFGFLRHRFPTTTPTQPPLENSAQAVTVHDLGQFTVAAECIRELHLARALALGLEEPRTCDEDARAPRTRGCNV